MAPNSGNDFSGYRHGFNGFLVLVFSFSALEIEAKASHRYWACVSSALSYSPAQSKCGLWYLHLKGWWRHSDPPFVKHGFWWSGGNQLLDGLWTPACFQTWWSDRDGPCLEPDSEGCSLMFTVRTGVVSRAEVQCALEVLHEELWQEQQVTCQKFEDFL